jgi:hypothetical protein
MLRIIILHSISILDKGSAAVPQHVEVEVRFPKAEVEFGRGWPWNSDCSDGEIVITLFPPVFTFIYPQGPLTIRCLSAATDNQLLGPPLLNIILPLAPRAHYGYLPR